MKFLYKLSILFLLIPAIVVANNEGKRRHEKSKKISKTFDVSSKATLSVKNKFGNINVTSWNKNTIQIDVNVIVKGNDLDDVEDKLKSVYIDFENTSTLVEAETNFKEKSRRWWSWGNKNKTSYEINYTIKIPVTNNIKLMNDYGNITLDKLEGEADINCDYGKITLGRLLGENTSINLDYCKNSSITSMKSGSINVDYAGLTIDKSENVKVNSDYSTLKFDKAKNITFNTDYGSIYANDVEAINGNGDYTSVSIGTLRKNFKVNSDYGRIKIENLAKGFETVYIDSEYASIKIGIDEKSAFDFVVDLQFAGFRKSGNVEIFKEIKKNNKKYYEGKYNGGSQSTVKIKSQFGGVSFYEN